MHSSRNRKAKLVEVYFFLEETNLQTPEPNSQKTLYLLKKLNFCLNILSKENHMVCHKSRKGNKRAYR